VLKLLLPNNSTSSTKMYCNGFLAEILGFGESRSSIVRTAIAEVGPLASLEDIAPHRGRGRKPVDITSARVYANIFRAIERITRPNPSGNTLIAMTGADGGFAGYLRKVQAGAQGAENISPSTISRANDKYLHEKNLRGVLIELIAHNACPLCKDGNHKINVAHRRTVEKRQALEDVVAAIASSTGEEATAVGGMGIPPVGAAPSEIEALKRELSIAEEEEAEVTGQLQGNTSTSQL